MISLVLLGLVFAENSREHTSRCMEIIKGLQALPESVAATLKLNDQIEEISKVAL